MIARPSSLPDRLAVGLPEPLCGFGRTAVMGILNVTPDSFSDGGRWLDPGLAAERGRELLSAGADLVDVGGESTRPGAGRVDEDEELRRVIPVVDRLVAGGASVSVDTMRSVVARAAVDHGAAMVNDVSGGLADPAMAGVVAGTGVPYVVMHWRGHADGMDRNAVYVDVLSEVAGELADRVNMLLAGGVAPGQLVVDPGIGFAKTGADNWRLLSALSEFVGWGLPVLVGASRKRFLGDLVGGGPDAPERDAATAAVTAFSAAAGAWAVRVHDVRSSRAAVLVAAEWFGGRGGMEASSGSP